MRTKLALSIITILFCICDVHAQQKDILDSISTYLRTSDSHEFSRHFSSAVSISIMDEEQQHTKAQSEVIIRNFLSRNKPVTVKELHRLTSNPGYKIAVYALTTSSKKFRVLVSLSESGSQFLVKEIRIEDDNE